MAVTVHQILNDAKRLVNQLREQEVSVDNMNVEANVLCNNVSAMKEYHEDVNDQNFANQIRSGPLVVFNVQENKHIMELQQENRELKDSLEEHQSVLELIMSKYRQQVTKLVQTSSKRNESSYSNCSQELQKLTDNICEIADVMKESVKADDIVYAQEQEKLTALITENKGLRELLHISKTYGSLTNPLNAPEMVDKEIQTDAT